MKACEICDDQTSLLTCKHVGGVCFDCWGSGIHEVLKRKYAAMIKNLRRITELLYGKKEEIPPVCPNCKETATRWMNKDRSLHWRCIICNQEVAA